MLQVQLPPSEKVGLPTEKKIFLSIDKSSAVINIGNTCSNKQKFFELRTTLKGVSYSGMHLPKFVTFYKCFAGSESWVRLLYSLHLVAI